MAFYSTMIIRDMEKILTLRKNNRNIPGGRALARLLEEDGISQQTLADRDGVRLQSVVQTLRHLEKDGYIRFERNPMDHREKLVFLTESGRERGAAHLSFSAYCSKVMQPLTQEEQKILSELLTKVLEGQPEQD